MNIVYSCAVHETHPCIQSPRGLTQKKVRALGNRSQRFSDFSDRRCNYSCRRQRVKVSAPFLSFFFFGRGCHDCADGERSSLNIDYIFKKNFLSAGSNTDQTGVTIV